MQARLAIDDSGYRLARDAGTGWIELAVLPGGPVALLRGSGSMDERALEAAIEHAEDWLMPHAAALSGAQLEVIDSTGRLASGLRDVFSADARQWDAEQIEALFLELGYMIARPRLASTLDGKRDFVAHIVMLRELAHHSKLRLIVLRD